MNDKKKILVICGAIFLIFIFLSLFENSKTTGKMIQQIDIVPLSQEEILKVQQILTSSEFIKDIPKKRSISLIFFDFENDQKRWRNEFLIGRDKLLSKGNPDVRLSLHSKYIAELNEDNLCEVIKSANGNGDIGFYSEDNKAILLIKYASMLKYKDCFGF